MAGFDAWNVFVWTFDGFKKYNKQLFIWADICAKISRHIRQYRPNDHMEMCVWACEESLTKLVLCKTKNYLNHWKSENVYI